MKEISITLEGNGCTEEVADRWWAIYGAPRPLSQLDLAEGDNVCLNGNSTWNIIANLHEKLANHVWV
jgi:hypothetical protein